MEMTCETCHRIFNVNPSRVLIGKGRFCNLICYKIWRDRFKHNLSAAIKISPDSNCWIWLGGKSGRGYGMAWNGTRWEKAHRFFYKKHKGPIPEGLNVCHHCDTRLCVNPDHLFLGTAKDNHADSVAKGRAKFPPHYQGCEKPNAKLTAEQVREIRAKYSFRKYTSVILAKEYGVSPPAILYVVHGYTYKNVS